MFTIKSFPSIDEINQIADAKLPYNEEISKDLQTDLHFFNEAYDFSEKAGFKKSNEKDGFVDAHKQIKKQPKQVKKFAGKKTFKKTTKKVVKRTFRKK